MKGIRVHSSSHFARWLLVCTCALLVSCGPPPLIKDAVQRDSYIIGYAMGHQLRTIAAGPTRQRPILYEAAIAGALDGWWDGVAGVLMKNRGTGMNDIPQFARDAYANGYAIAIEHYESIKMSVDREVFEHGLRDGIFSHESKLYDNEGNPASLELLTVLALRLGMDVTIERQSLLPEGARK